MRKFTQLCMALMLGTMAAKAQTVATFDTLTLPKADTFYVNYDNYGNDVGFDDGLAHFPCVYDSSFGFKFWSSGFAYSNMTDSLTPGYGNQYSAITGKGYNNSTQYVVSWSDGNKIFLKGKANGQPVNGFYITNNSYAYYSMKDGDAFAKKFGGVSGNDSDWYKVIIYGYHNGNKTTDSVEAYLADFRSQDNTKDTILKGWMWVNLLPLGDVDSLEFNLNSSDVGQFGMNTPAYFCMDNFSTYETESVNETPMAFAAKVYPNPAVSQLHVEMNDRSIRELYISDMTGKVVSHLAVKDAVTLVPLQALAPGTYILSLVGEKTASVRFVKQ
jgi:hypothetical protein